MLSLILYIEIWNRTSTKQNKTKQHAAAKMIKEERKISKNKNGTFLFRKDATVKSKILKLSVKFFMTFTLNVYIYTLISCA